MFCVGAHSTARITASRPRRTHIAHALCRAPPAPAPSLIPPFFPRPLAHPPPTVSPTPPHLLVFTPPAPACLPADALKRQPFSFLQSISNFIVSLPNLSEKDVKGLLSRKQPLHTSPNRSKKGEAGVSRLSFLRYLSSPPRLRP